MSAEPPGGASDVDRLGPWRVRYDRRLAPTSVHRGTVSLRSGSVAVLLSVRYDPINQEVVARPFRDHPLVAGVEYTLTVDGVRDLDGVPAEPAQVRFVTGAGAEGGAPEGQTPWAAVAELFTARCVDGCHGGTRPAMGLDLSSPEAVRATAIGVPAVQTGGRDEVPRRGLGGLPIIDALPGGGRPATSYLIYKMLGDEHALGAPMPPEGATNEELRLVADWILAGAPTTH